MKKNVTRVSVFFFSGMEKDSDMYRLTITLSCHIKLSELIRGWILLENEMMHS